MKTLTLTQPWATLVAIQEKSIETRSWWTSYRGPLAIHAAKGYPPGCRKLCLTEPFLTALKAAGLIQYGVWHPSNNDLPLGAVVAVCRITDCVAVHGMAHTLSAQERAFGDYTFGRFAWLLADVHPLPAPIPATGRLGLWDWTPPERV
jgi:activating signal cointegrator 1